MFDDPFNPSRSAALDLIIHLRAAMGLLDFQRDAALRQAGLSICEAWDNPAFRIAVLGPFNYGKSTLLNAVLGDRTLPIDLIPTTGAAIRIQWGETLHTRIQFRDGTAVSEAGSQVLQRYAVLDGERRMNESVAAVEVCCPHPLLKLGVEFLDLPGTNDRQSQDDLVREQLLTADLIVQVLDARQLLTLGERENFRDWLLDRGIQTVMFVVNFVNLLPSDDQSNVLRRLRFVAESFRGQLPTGVSNLYRVDALPALRAKLQGDGAAIQMSGLALFESALQTVAMFQGHNAEKNLKMQPRLVEVATQVRQALVQKIACIDSASVTPTINGKPSAKYEIQQKAARLIQTGFHQSVSEFEVWLSVANLKAMYQSDILVALEKNDFASWERGPFKAAVVDYQQSIVDWVDKACLFFEHQHPGALAIPFPSQPHEQRQAMEDREELQQRPTQLTPKIAPVAAATGLGWVLGGPMGAAVAAATSYILSDAKPGQTPTQPINPTLDQLSQIYREAAEVYLTQFSRDGMALLQQYQTKVLPVLMPDPGEPADLPEEPPANCLHQQAELKLLLGLVANLDQSLHQLSE